MPPRPRNQPRKDRFSVASLTYAEIAELNQAAIQAKTFGIGVEKWMANRLAAKSQGDDIVTKRFSVMRAIYREAATDVERARRFTRVHDNQRPGPKTMPRVPHALSKDAFDDLEPGQKTYRFRRLAALDADGKPIPGEMESAEIEFRGPAGMTKKQQVDRVEKIEDRSRRTASRRGRIGGSPPIGKGLLVPVEVRG